MDSGGNFGSGLHNSEQAFGVADSMEQRQRRDGFLVCAEFEQPVKLLFQKIQQRIPEIQVCQQFKENTKQQVSSVIVRELVAEDKTPLGLRQLQIRYNDGRGPNADNQRTGDIRRRKQPDRHRLWKSGVALVQSQKSGPVTGLRKAFYRTHGFFPAVKRKKKLYRGAGKPQNRQQMHVVDADMRNLRIMVIQKGMQSIPQIWDIKRVSE